jgi:aldehyde dehydrogenase (NAD+)
MEHEVKRMEWTRERIQRIVESQREYFRSGRTLPVSRRIEMLKKLRNAVEEHRKELEDSLHQDLGRHSTEAFFCDIGSTIMEINEIIRGLKKWAKPEKHFSGLHCFPSMVTRVYKMPYGVTLIISPFNFPILLSLGVLAASISGGNTAVLKVSSKSKACSVTIQKIIGETFPEEYVTVIDGGHDAADMCLEERFDKIFYTGSPRVAVHVLEMAAKHLTPVALELGGETGNWCVIRKDADLKDAARKIAFFKMLNSGQICININQVAVAEEAADEFVRELKAAFTEQIGEDAVANPEYPKLISEKAYESCAEEAEQYRERIVFGGYGNPETGRYAPTVIYPVRPDEPVVRHELFNPLLSVVPFRDAEADELMDLIAKREHGLALYLFTRDKKWARKVMSTQQYGGGCINEVCLHMMVRGVPFNGTGHSGMGAYHGEWGFREFTHPSTVLTGSIRFNLPLREHPYTKNEKRKRRMLQAFEK